MCNEGVYYAYMASFCDDLFVVHKYPDHVFDSIQGKGFIIKETSASEYLLGGYFERVKEPKTDNKILTWVSKTYVKRMIANFNNTFGFEPSKQHSDMPSDYKPELDTTDPCNNDDKDQYWKFIGEIKWSVSLGRINIIKCCSYSL